jgi:predicted ATPase
LKAKFAGSFHIYNNQRGSMPQHPPVFHELVGSTLSLDSSSATTTLYGRDEEINLLMQVYQRCLQRHDCLENNQEEEGKSANSTCELVLISGRSGTGKTALANTLIPVVQKDTGFFLSGKCELSGSNNKEPYAVLVSAFEKWIAGLFSDDDEATARDSSQSNNHHHQHLLSQIGNAIQNAVGSEGKILTDMIPSLTRIIGSHDETCKICGNEGLQRLKLVFARFCRAVSSVAPMVLFLDDLQWANQASLALMQALLQPMPGLDESMSSASSSLLVIASYRSDEVDVDHDTDADPSTWQQPRPSPFSVHLRKYWLPHQQQQPTWLSITSIELSNLDESSLNELMASKLQQSCHVTQPLTKLVYCQSEGNVFHALQYLRMLIDNKILYRDQDTQQVAWDDDLDDTLQKPRLQKSAEEVVCDKLHNMLSAFQLEVLQVAACLGDEFEATKVGLLMDGLNAEVIRALDEAVTQGLLDQDLHQGLYRFHHDKVRQATLSTVADENDLSFQIGQKLWQRLSPNSLRASVHVVVNLLNKGIGQVRDQEMRFQMAALNLEAGVDAASLAAFSDAARYLEQGMILLKTSDDCWKERYQLTLDLYSALADVEVCNQNFSHVKELTEEVFRNAKNHKDKMTCYVAQINAMGQNGSVLEAMNFGIKVLRLIGEPLPTVPNRRLLLTEKIKTIVALRGRSNQAVLSLPPMIDGDKMAIIHILDILIPYSFQTAPSYAFLIGMKIVQLCLKHGLTKRAAVGFVTFACFLSRNDRKNGYRIGQLALSLVDNSRAREMIPRVHLSFYFLTHHWTRPIAGSLKPLKQTYRTGMEMGDIEYAMYCSYFRCTHSLFAGVILVQVNMLASETIKLMTQYKQENAILMLNSTLYYAQHMMNGETDAFLFRDNGQASDNRMGLLNHYSLGAQAAYIFGDYAKAKSFVDQRLCLHYEHVAIYGHALDTFYDGLIAVALARQGNHYKRNIQVARRMLRRLNLWAKDCPENFLNKQRLLHAELRSITWRAKINGTHKLYGQSFELASKYGFTHEAALACERAGDYMHQCGNNSLAATYWTKAHSLYNDWGGTKKADHCLNRLRKPTLSEPSSQTFIIEAT